MSSTSLSLHHALAHTGWVVSAVTFVGLLLATGPTLSALSVGAVTAFAVELLALLGGAIGVGMGWTMAQALAHTRLGSQSMRHGSLGPSQISVRRVLIGAALVAAVSVCGEWFLMRGLLAYIWQSHGSVSMMLWALADVAWYGLGMVALISAGLSFGLEVTMTGWQLRQRKNCQLVCTPMGPASPGHR